MNEQDDKGVRAALVHCGITVSSVDRALGVFRDLFGMHTVREFELTEPMSLAMFDLAGRAKVMVFGAAGASLEVFITPRMKPGESRYDHLALEVEDRPGLLRKAEAQRFDILRMMKGEREIVFIKDLDGNFYEINQR